MGLDAREFFQDCPWRIPDASALLPHLQGFPQNEGEEADEDMGLHTIGTLMPDRSNA